MFSIEGRRTVRAPTINQRYNGNRNVQLRINVRYSISDIQLLDFAIGALWELRYAVMLLIVGWDYRDIELPILSIQYTSIDDLHP